MISLKGIFCESVKVRARDDDLLELGPEGPEDLVRQDSGLLHNLRR